MAPLMNFHRTIWCIFWLLAIAYGCGLFYATVYSDWINSPTVTEVFSADYKVQNNFFPTITLCSNNKIVKRQLQSVLLTKQWKGLSEKDDDFAGNFEICNEMFG